MKAKKFRNQTSEQILKHLANLLSGDNKYNLFVDPLGIYFTIKESVRTGGDKNAKKRADRRGAQEGLSKGRRKKVGTSKRTRPKIRSVKKFRTVPLKGQVY